MLLLSQFLSSWKFRIILLPTVNFSLVCKGNIKAKLKKFVTKFVILILHIWFSVNSGICCTKVFMCGRLFTHWNWQNLFIHIIQYWPQFVKLVIIRAVRIGLLVLLKLDFCQTYFPDSLLPHVHIYAQNLIPSIRDRSQRTNNTDPRKLLSTICCTVHWFVWI